MGEKDEKQYFLKKPDGEYCPITEIANVPEHIPPDQNDDLPNFSEYESFTINFKMNSNTKKRLFWTIFAPDKINRNNFRKNHGIPMIRRVAGRKGVRKYR
ncbi:hypothetical protein [Blautia obeum]|jgi:hypothetical protein|uniref:hypothetical protein n=1 Tax=Blautia obeum TaxID=40520 RepID=UPI00319E75B6